MLLQWSGHMSALSTTQCVHNGTLIIDLVLYPASTADCLMYIQDACPVYRGGMGVPESGLETPAASPHSTTRDRGMLII